MKLIIRILALTVGLAVLAGCESATSRIKQNPELFARLTPEQQGLIREGRIESGFTGDMVKLALGEPDFVMAHAFTNEYSHKKVSSVTWSYRSHAGGPWGNLDHEDDHGSNSGHEVKVVSSAEWSMMMVIFRDGQVISITQTK